MGTPLPRNAFHLIINPLRSTASGVSSGSVTTRSCPRIAIQAITRKVSDIRSYPELDKATRRKLRADEKRIVRKGRETERGTPRGFGNRTGVGIHPMGSSQRIDAEREARLKYLGGKPGSRELAQKITGVLSGGKADLLLHTLRARWLERMEKIRFDEEVVLTRDVKRMYQRLIDEILFCDSLYYCDDPQPRISDAEYDELIMHLIELERFFPELICPQSPSQNIAHGAAVRSSKLALENDIESEPVTAMRSFSATVPVTESRFPQYRHKAVMLSLDNAYSHDDLISFARRAAEATSQLSAELKIDGVALSLEYRNRKLFSCATRGTGRVGDQVTENVRAALLGRGVVDTIADPSAPSFLVVRGEVYITPQEFAEVNASLEKKLSNPRNAAAGALKHKVPAEAKARMLRFVAYECLTGSLEEVEEVESSNSSQPGAVIQTANPALHNTWSTQSKTLEHLSEWGFGKMPRHEVCDTLAVAESFASKVEEERGALALEVDGVVFKFEDSKAREAAGHTARAPRGAIAYKFAAQSKLTHVQDVVMQVSRNGLITPVALLDPIRVGGAVLSRATLHNFDEIRRLGVAIGDEVRVERGGDVIPKIVKVEKKSSFPERKVVEPPSQCPSCLGEVISEADEVTGAVLVGCKNASKCLAQVLGRLMHFSGKDAMDIKGLGKKTADKLIRDGHVIVLADLFRLTLGDLLSLEGYAKKSAEALLDYIREASTKRSLERLIFGLGLPGVGRTGAQALALQVSSLEKLLDIAADENGQEVLMTIPNFAEKTAVAVHSYLNRERTQSELKAMIELVQPSSVVDEEEALSSDSTVDLGRIAGKTFVFTGKLTIMSRPELKKWIKSAGGVVASDVNRKTDYVVVGLEPGQKSFKAQRLKVKTLQEEEFLELFKPNEDDSKSILKNAE